mgnify:CR=1 FL=1
MNSRWEPGVDTDAGGSLAVTRGDARAASNADNAVADDRHMGATLEQPLDQPSLIFGSGSRVKTPHACRILQHR